MNNEKDWDLIIKGFEEYESKCEKEEIKYYLSMMVVGIVCTTLAIIIHSIIPLYSIFIISLVTIGK